MQNYATPEATSLEKLEPMSWRDGQMTVVVPLLEASRFKPERIVLAQVMPSVRRRNAFAKVESLTWYRAEADARPSELCLLNNYRLTRGEHAASITDHGGPHGGTSGHFE